MLKLLWFVVLLLGCAQCSQGTKPVYTQVTFLYDIKRGDLKKFNRPFSYYLDFFGQLLKTDSNLIVFGTKQLSEFVWQRRQKNNTVFVEKSLQSFRDYWYYSLTQKVREKFLLDPGFENKENPQYSLQFYNVIVFAKYYVMEEALKHDKWNTDILVWTDGGLMHVFPSIVQPENAVSKLYHLLQPQWTFYGHYSPYRPYMGYHDQEFPYINRPRKSYENILAGIQGGQIQALTDVSNTFDNLLRITLENGDMNSEEAVMSIMVVRYPFIIPTVLSVQLRDFWSRKIHNYEHLSRVSVNPRHWSGVMRADGKLQAMESKTLAKRIFKQVETPKEPISITPLQDSTKLNQENTSLLIKNLKFILFAKISSQKKINTIKISALGIAFVIYLFLAIKNRPSKICMKVPEQGQAKLNLSDYRQCE